MEARAPVSIMKSPVIRRHVLVRRKMAAWSANVRKLSVRATSTCKRAVMLVLRIVLVWVFLPTYWFADFRKDRVREQGAKAVGDLIRKYNTMYLALAGGLALTLWLTGPWRGLYAATPTAYWVLVGVTCWFFAFSRPNEIFFAFLRDAVAKVNGERPKSDLSIADRITLALKSYVELILNFANMYYIFPVSWFDDKFDSYWHALYFSGVTITTLGYGDIAPVFWIPRLLTVYEVLCGFILLIVSFAIYAGLGRGVSSDPD